MIIKQLSLEGVVLFFQESKDCLVVPVYQTIQGAIEGKSESTGVLMANGEIISLGKSMGYAKDVKEVDENIIRSVSEALGI